MKLLSKIFVVSVIVITSMGASAELIPTDWKVTGDARATLDKSTGIEWLKLQSTTAMSINTVKSKLNTDFSGWRLPSESEMLTMWQTIMPSWSTAYLKTYKSNTLYGNQVWSFFGNLGQNYQNGQYDKRSYGLFEKDNGAIGTMGVIYKDEYYLTYGPNMVVDMTPSFSNVATSVYLVSDGGTTLSSINDPSLNANNANAPINSSSVPLPATAALLGLGLLGFAARRKKNA